MIGGPPNTMGGASNMLGGADNTMGGASNTMGGASNMMTGPPTQLPTSRQMMNEGQNFRRDETNRKFGVEEKWINRIGCVELAIASPPELSERRFTIILPNNTLNIVFCRTSNHSSTEYVYYYYSASYMRWSL